MAFVSLILQRSLSFLFSRLTVLVFVFLGLMLAWFPFDLHFSGRRLFVSDFRLFVSGRRLWFSFAVHLLRHRCAFTTLSLRLCLKFLGLAEFDASSLSVRQFCRLESSVSFTAYLLRLCRALLCVIGARRTSVFDGLLRLFLLNFLILFAHPRPRFLFLWDRFFTLWSLHLLACVAGFRSSDGFVACSRS